MPNKIPMNSNPMAEHEPWTPLRPVPEEKAEAGTGIPTASKNFHTKRREGGEEAQPLLSPLACQGPGQDSKPARSSLATRILKEDWIIEDARREEDREREEQRRREDRERKLVRLQEETDAMSEQATMKLAQAEQDHEWEESRGAEDRERQDERRRENRQLAEDRHSKEYKRVDEVL